MPVRVKSERRQVFVAERDTNLLHVEERFVTSRGRSIRSCVTACGRVLNFDSGEAAGRIFAPLSLSNLRADPCDECIQAEGEERMEALR